MGFEVINGDCLEVMRGMADASVDAVVTDPPYCSGGFTESAKRQAKGQGLRSGTIREIGWFINDNMGSAGIVWLLRAVAVESYRLLKPGGSLCLFTDWRMVTHLGPALESSGLRLQNIVVWDKGNPGLGVGFRPQHEMILHYCKGTGVFHDQATGSVLSAKRIHPTERLHQTEKPVSLIERILRVVVSPGGLVLDPFCGSGTTGVACVEAGNDFVGIEREAGHVETARSRIAAAVATPRLAGIQLAGALSGGHGKQPSLSPSSSPE